MKKIITTVLVAMTLIIGPATVAAQSNSTTNPNAGKCARTEQCQRNDDKKQCKDSDKKSREKKHKKDGKKNHGRAAGYAVNMKKALDGINLTAEQQSKINAILPSSQKKDAAPGTDITGDKRPSKPAACRARLAQIKDVLTPEQYTRFLENLAVNNCGDKAQCGKKAGKCTRDKKQKS